MSSFFGRKLSTLRSFFNSAELYDCLTDTWRSCPKMLTRRHGAAACKLEGKVYVLGGMQLWQHWLPLQWRGVLQASLALIGTPLVLAQLVWCIASGS